MNTSKIKAYAPAARRDFIKSVTDKAHMLGLSEKEILPVEIKGDVAIIGGRPFPKQTAEQRKHLEERIKRDGFEMVMRSMAYTWFNRFVAIRYMELHDYLEHGFRVLSNPSGSNVPEILEQAAHVDLPGLNKDEVVTLRLAGKKDEELYRLLLVAQSNALNKAMPFLFETIGGATELLLPDNLLHSNSLIRNLVKAIPEEDWQEVEIIGWLYQFYISEKKDEVIGKVVKSEDIPAATQLFTPNWIVKYMVQNSLGRKWMMTYPDSHLISKGKMEFYIEPAEQEPEVQKQLSEITPKELNPEEITLLDPACGSGHILSEAYDLFREIYQERGYRVRDIPRLILEKNLYGLDIDDRAAQLTSFCLLMKAREDDRRILTRDDVRLNVLSIQSSKGIDVDGAASALLKEKTTHFVRNNDLFPDSRRQPSLAVTERPCVSRGDIADLVELFEHGKTFGSLIQIPDELVAKLDEIGKVVDDGVNELVSMTVARQLKPIVEQSKILTKMYDCVVANPPYMGSKGMNLILKNYGKRYHPDSKSDLFAMFIERIIKIVGGNGYIGLMTPFVWMFLKSYKKIREALLTQGDIVSLIRPEYHAFFDSAYVPICTFVEQIGAQNSSKGTYIDLSDFYGYDVQPKKVKEAINNPSVSYRYQKDSHEFRKIPGWAIAYWISSRANSLFECTPSLSKVCDLKQGLATGHNDTFLKYWNEVSINDIKFNSESIHEAKISNSRWFPCQKGGENRRWYGNHNFIVNWYNDGEELREFHGSVIRNPNYYFREGLTWSSLTVSSFSMRYNPKGFVFESKGGCAFPKNLETLPAIITFCNSKVINYFLSVLSPTMDYSQGPVGNVPFINIIQESIKQIYNEAVNTAQNDWDSFETSWDFKSFPWLTAPLKVSTTKQSFQNWLDYCNSQIKRMQELETENNRLYIGAYGLQDELTPEVPEEQITLARADQEEDVKRLLSYSIGCMMGRYCLDEPGLIYAHSDNEGFDHSRYKSFSADDDGIVPIMDIGWFDDDASNRFLEFLKVAWSFDTLAENIRFIADTLGPKRGEDAHFTIRRYFSTKFFKDHLKTYKKRPIYWLFSSGKQKAFECLVYLHRYNESTLPRMRSAYVTPLQGKFNARIDYLQNEIKSVDTASAKKKLQKELEVIKKKQVELAKFDEELRHYADKRITLDLDDGVKVNYGKFGNLLADKKAVTGKK